MVHVFLQTSENHIAEHVAKSLESIVGAKINRGINNFQLLKVYRGRIGELIKEGDYDVVIVHPSEVEYSLSPAERKDRQKGDQAVIDYLHEVLSAARAMWIPVIVLGDSEFRGNSHEKLRQQIELELSGFRHDLEFATGQYYFNLSKTLDFSNPNPEYRRSLEHLSEAIHAELKPELANTK
jgi:hypothetical protein